MSRMTILLILCSLPLLAPAAEPGERRQRPSAEAMIVDGLIVRPLSLAGTVIGTGIFVVTLPFSAIGGNVDEAGNALVMEPARATFGPCLGCLPEYGHPYRPYRDEDASRQSGPAN